MYHYKPFIIVNLLMGIYLGVNIDAAFGKFFPNRYVFWLVIMLLTQIYWLVRFFSFRRGIELRGMPFWVTSMLFTIFTVSLITVVAVDTLWLILHLRPLTPFLNHFNENIVLVGLTCMGLIFLQLVIGFYNAYTPKITYHNIVLSKKIKKQFRIALLADIHIKSYTSVKSIKHMVDMINGLNADLVVLAGDIVDGEPEPFINKGFGEEFKRIKSKYGVFAVPGNHEYYGFEVDKMLDAYSKSGITVLRDEIYPVNDLGITLIGRDDHSSYVFGVSRLLMKELTAKIDSDAAKILIEHQPRSSVIRAARDAGIDLQLSGHTHNGQAFPINLLIKGIYKNPWGFWKNGSYNLFVTCGYGTWGTNIRTFSHSEIMCIDVTRREQVVEKAKVLSKATS